MATESFTERFIIPDHATAAPAKAVSRPVTRPQPPVRRLDRLALEKALTALYPELQWRELLPLKFWYGPLVPDMLIRCMDGADLRRVVVIGCGKGILANTLALLYPQVEIVGIDMDAEHIRQARQTLQGRSNIKFVLGNASIMSEIPCNRIIYDNALSLYEEPERFQTLLARTIKWIVPDGDFIIKESPVRLMCQPGFLRHAWSGLRRVAHMEAYLSGLLREIGYVNPQSYRYGGWESLPTELYFHLSRRHPRTGSGPRTMTVRVNDWHDAGEECIDSVVGFLFADQADDFTGDFAPTSGCN